MKTAARLAYADNLLFTRTLCSASTQEGYHVAGPVSPSTYVTKIMPRIEGWLSDVSAHLVIATSTLQASLGIRGAVAEIGIHHGKLFILLDLLRRDGDQALAIDVFENQSLNVDHSGLGDRKTFENNLAAVGRNSSDITVIADSSVNVSATQIINSVGRVRLFSVDGGHTVEIATHDLHLAKDSLAGGGVVIVDDVFNWEWPGVAEALSRCLTDSSFKLVPVALTPEKLLLTHPDHFDLYSQGLREMMQQGPFWSSARSKEFYGNPVWLFSAGSRAQRRQRAISAHPLYYQVRELRVVRAVRPLANRVNQRLP